MVRHIPAAAGILLAMSPVTASAQTAPGPAAGPRAEMVQAYEEAGAETGLMYGVRIGYDFLLAPNLLLGPEGEASNSTLETIATATVETDFVVTSETAFGRTLYAGGRIALIVSPRVSIYGRAGYVNRRLSGRISIDRLAPSGTNTLVASQRFQSFHDGLRVGVGTQARLMGSLYGGIEYRFDAYRGLPDSHQTALTLGLRF